MSRTMITWLSFIIAGYVFILIALYAAQERPIRAAMMSQTDEEYILKALSVRAADDCVLRPISPGAWSCTEFKTGKVFIIRR